LNKPYSIYSLGDSAVTLDLGHLIDEQLNGRAIAISEWLRGHAFPGLLDIIVAYSSVTVFYDPVATGRRQPADEDGVYKYVGRLLEEAYAAVGAPVPVTPAGEPVRIPVCYGGSYGPDLEELCRVKNMTHEDIIRLHCSIIYRVYMIGFLPGFPYLGIVDPRLETGRKQRPAPVTAGGVGIAGNQTGIYPVNSPGGWQIIGRTPVRLFDPAMTPPVKLSIGDRVQFYPVSPAEFQAMCPD
jgi:inhibitor of KinA